MSKGCDARPRNGRKQCWLSLKTPVLKDLTASASGAVCHQSMSIRPWWLSWKVIASSSVIVPHPFL